MEYDYHTTLTNLTWAILLGMLPGINRELKRKPAGLGTHALVSLGAALAMVIVNQLHPYNSDALSRVVQGVVTGIGFIGAGVIIHHNEEPRVEGLTTAASIWVAAMIGLACGSGQVVTALIGTGLLLVVLTVGKWLEKRLANWLDEDKKHDSHHSRPPE